MSARARPQGQGSADAAESLRTAISAALRPVAAAVSGVRAVQARLAGCEDLVPLMQEAAAVILSCEALHGAAKDAEQAARKALAQAMTSTGATTVSIAAHTVSLREASRRVIVTDPALLPPRFMVQPPTPPPAPDLSAIAFKLREGREVPGAVLGNGSAPTIQIRNRTA